ncbi:hypothetical protein PMI36_01506 [Pseudomonas sp. GM79]|uniref:hypothetical protein n=1 Tax=Pseudomonas sp. GM79 TaxID=1144338 RepID=UPI00026F6A2F|nr:hypothetical protein [Pseudomonas sp. GM79]EJN25888.1 hypothetical protein PMI36_01506 [Pseudomonas sp. GM79]
MTPTNGIIELRTLDEITEHYVIDPGGILTKENYSIPIRPYRLIKPDAKCQYLKKGKRCAQDHQHGYIVECKDGSQVLIGNCCALNHLGLDDEEIVGRLKGLSTIERQNVRRHRIENMLGQRMQFIERVKAALKLLRVVQGQANHFISTLPPQVVSNLVDRWKRNSLEVFWEYMIVKRAKDEKGKPYVEKNWYPHSYGKIKGLGIWLDLEEQGYTLKLYEFLRQLEGTPVKQRLSQAELDQAEATFKYVSELLVIERELNAQSKLLAEFSSPANLLLSVQLSSNKELRAKAVEAVHLLIGQPCKTSFERFVADVDQALQRQHSADGIRIAS